MAGLADSDIEYSFKLIARLASILFENANDKVSFVYFVYSLLISIPLWILFEDSAKRFFYVIIIFFSTFAVSYFIQIRWGASLSFMILSLKYLLNKRNGLFVFAGSTSIFLHYAMLPFVFFIFSVSFFKSIRPNAKITLLIILLTCMFFYKGSF